jgi:hypothetical protein
MLDTGRETGNACLSRTRHYIVGAKLCCKIDLDAFAQTPQQGVTDNPADCPPASVIAIQKRKNQLRLGLLQPRGFFQL